MKSLSIVLAGATLLSLAACGGKAGEIIHDAVNGKGATADAKLAYTSYAWKTGCTKSVAGKTQEYFGLPFAAYRTVDTVHITGDLSRVTMYYADVDCKNETLAVDELRTFNFGDNTTGDNYTYNFTEKKVQITPVTDEAAQKMNDFMVVGYCNAKDWKTGDAKDVSSAAGTPVICVGTEKTEVAQYGVVQVTGGGNSEVYYSGFTTDPGLAAKTADAGPDAVKFTR